jgi:hypothetical protein
MPDLIRHPEGLEKSGCARSLRSFRLPSVARLEFTPMKIGAGMTPFMKTVVHGKITNRHGHGYVLYGGLTCGK